MSSCPSTSQCQINYLEDIQRSERSAADQTGLLAGKALYGHQIATATTAIPTPAFASGADYIRWKKTVTQLYATSQKLTCPPRN